MLFNTMLQKISAINWNDWNLQKKIGKNSFQNFILKAEQLGIVIAGGNGEEDQSNQFNSPEDLSFDGEDNLIRDIQISCSD